MTIANRSAKLAEFEILRAICIIFLMFVHSDVFSLVVFGIKLEPIGPYMGAFMLGSFFFMAGYFTEHSRRHGEKPFFAYIWSKFIRLFPPYWLALALFMTVLRFSLKRFDFFIYVLDLQFIFSPTYIKALLTLWYLSVVFAYYVIFGVFLSRPSFDLIIWSMIVFSVSYLLSHLYGLFDDRFFEYYFVFLTGVLLARHDKFREGIFYAPAALQILIGLTGAILFGIFEFGDYRVRTWPYLLSSNLFILSWIVLALRLFRINGLNLSIWGPISYGSFFAYLFHRPIWEIMFAVIRFPWDIYGGWYRLIPGSIFVFVICYYLQMGYDFLLRKVAKLWKQMYAGPA